MSARPSDALIQILDLARWAPSGDNTQPWRFEIRGDDHVVVYGFDTRDYCVYDLDGHASQLSIGAMLETIRIAAGAYGLRAEVNLRTGSAEDLVFDVSFHDALSADRSPLVSVIRERTVNRRALSTRPLTLSEKQILIESLPPRYSLYWLEGVAQRWRIARILSASAYIRLTTPEAFEAHQRAIAWDGRNSEEAIPLEAVGFDPLTAALTRWVMRDWRRVRFMNRYLAGTVVPRLQLDLIPALACAAHVLVLADRPAHSIQDHIDAGAAVQRFWLAVTSLRLQHQPEMTPLIFSRYSRVGRKFSSLERVGIAARRIKERLEALCGTQVVERAVWMGRIGAGSPPRVRSVRLPLQRLLVDDARTILKKPR